jgi:hypothetical protein
MDASTTSWIRDISVLIQENDTLIVGMLGILATVAVARIQARSHSENLRAIHQREDAERLRRYQEQDHADRQLVLEYIDQLLPRIDNITSLWHLAGQTNTDADQRKLYLRQQSLINNKDIDPAHPERNLGIRLAFLLFQLLAAMRSALNARWTRTISEQQVRFLSRYEQYLEPILTSTKYPGNAFLYREQIEIIADKMLIAKQHGVFRPLNWHEFTDDYRNDAVLTELTTIVTKKFQLIFDDSGQAPLRDRLANQARLAILQLYLIQIREDAGDHSKSGRREALQRMVSREFEHEAGEQNHPPQWYVFSPGDVERWGKPRQPRRWFMFGTKKKA